jgi:hypothetical protein
MLDVNVKLCREAQIFAPPYLATVTIPFMAWKAAFLGPSCLDETFLTRHSLTVKHTVTHTITVVRAAHFG